MQDADIKKKNTLKYYDTPLQAYILKKEYKLIIDGFAYLWVHIRVISLKACQRSISARIQAAELVKKSPLKLETLRWKY